jgi:hypothetical protein
VGKFGGFTAASRRIVRLPGGGTAFAKGATDDLTEQWLRVEHIAYTHLKGDFMPRSPDGLEEFGQSGPGITVT